MGQADRRARPGPRHGVPGLRAVPLADRAREHRLRPGRARPVAAARSRDTVDTLHRAGRPAELRRRLSAPALGRHEAARGDRPRAGQRRRGGADGRAVRRARRHDPRAPAGRAAGDLAAHQADRGLRHALDRGGDLPRRPRRGDDARARAASRATTGSSCRARAMSPARSSTTSAACWAPSCTAITARRRLRRGVSGPSRARRCPDPSSNV